MGNRHARQLAATSTLLSVRPVVAIPTNPSSTATQRVPLDCDKAVSI